MALGFWNDINLPNLEENVLPTKHRATPRAAEGRRPHGRAGAAAQALTAVERRRASRDGRWRRGIRLFRLLTKPAAYHGTHVWNRRIRGPAAEPGHSSRGTGAARVPRVRLRGHRRHRRRRRPRHAQEGRQARRAARRPRRRTRFPTARPASVTPAGRPTADRPTRTRTRTSPTTTSSPSSTTASSRTSPSSRTSCSPRATRSAARPTPRWPRCCSAASTARTAATSSRRSARPSTRLDGAFTLLAMHEDHPGLVVGARRNSPLVIGLGEGENFLASDVAAFVEHTRNALAIGQDEIVAITPDGRRRSPTSRAARSRSSRSK